MKILTQKGFVPFDGVLNQGIPNKLIDITFNDGCSITVTPEHKILILKNGKEKFKEAQIISKGTKCIGIGNSFKIVIDIRMRANETNEFVYDPLNVQNETNSYHSNSIISHNCNLLILDEFAFVERAEQFYTSTYPVITAGKTSKVIITSTANGIGNPFHTLWTGAVTKTNSYQPFTIHWSDVPGRDEQWKIDTIANSSERIFKQEFENSFFGSGNTLIDANKLLMLVAQKPIYVNEQETFKMYTAPIEEHEYIMTVDVSKGRGQDSSTFSITDISVIPFMQVATFKDNELSPLLFPSILNKYGTMYNNAYIIVESNDNGSMVVNSLIQDEEYENVYSEIKAGKMVAGIEMNKKIKRIGCSNLKDLVEEGKITLVDADTITELTTFVTKGTSYEASTGNHDDMVMTLVSFAWLSSTSYFIALTDVDIRSELFEKQMEAIHNELAPIGILGSQEEIKVGLEPNKNYESFGGQVWEICSNTGI